MGRTVRFACVAALVFLIVLDVGSRTWPFTLGSCWSNGRTVFLIGASDGWWFLHGRTSATGSADYTIRLFDECPDFGPGAWRLLVQSPRHNGVLHGSYWLIARFRFPWLLPLLPFLPSYVLAVFRACRRRRRRLRGLCLNCGYDIRGSACRCPECGCATEISRVLGHAESAD